ncbi:MAG: HAMP domain-containing histidine kinase [Oscillibacter sp.]|nr:HAMP domain-containing histidine kinase [Oscillibacter sp.]
MNMSPQNAFYFYSDHFRLNKNLFFCAAVFVVFAGMLWMLFRGMSRYFSEINQGIESLLADSETQIHLSPEMLPFERKLNMVKRTLEERKKETAQAERRKDELVMYLAHDIRTPLTSVIGYLNLLEEEPGIPAEQRAKRVRIALEKAYRLEAMMNEFFEITRYNSQQIALSKNTLDLYYMLVQLTDELTPVFAPRGNSVALRLDENLTVQGDAEKLARVFGNILKNAAAYSAPHTEITISAKPDGQDVVIQFQNQGADIPPEKLEALFDKFYRLDQARSTGTGGTGLGLAIAKEIVLLHGGSIQAFSENHTVTFSIRLPGASS